ncbi:transposase [Paraglaciecola sp. 25GB23A]|uniref:RNA-guided endonuclease InsQ/TnpB family protein n=1 Tax=Paraglaciecola sp. 25GB23A TaxID=3156068 RepID=UPI0032AFDD69
MKIAFKTRLLANNKQASHMLKACGVARFAWNWGLAAWNEQYKAFKEDSIQTKPSGMALKKQLNAIKKEQFPWMYEVSKYASQQPFIFLNQAWSDYFKKKKQNGKPVGRPRFKKKGKSIDSFYVGGDQVVVSGRLVKVPNLGWLKMAEPIKYGGHINSMTITRTADKWYVSFSMDVEVSMLPSKSQARCGVDLGINKLATLSNGDIRYWDTPRPLKSSLRKLARYQRRLVKKVKSSKGYQVLKMKIAQLHKRIADIRRNTLHQLTRYLTEHFCDVTIEDLNVKGMMANRTLARHIADVGLYEFRRQMVYKSDWYQTTLTIADRWFASSKLCSDCGVRNGELKLSDRVFRCECGNGKCRDYNASLNLEMYTAR